MPKHLGAISPKTMRRMERGFPPLTPASEQAADFRRTVLDPATLGARLDTDLGVERHADALERLVGELDEPEAASSSDLLLTSLIARAALLRRESRGAHFRSDAPASDPAWRGRIHWRRDHPPVFEEVVS
jgi:L-aspartate oxidase